MIIIIIIMIMKEKVGQISTNDLRFHFDRVLHAVRRGSVLTLTYRNKPLAKIVPIKEEETPISEGDPFYQFHLLAEPMGKLTNGEIDKVLYENP